MSNQTVCFLINEKNCNDSLWRRVTALTGVSDVRLNHAEATLSLAYDPAHISPEHLRQKLESLGCSVHLTTIGGC